MVIRYLRQFIGMEASGGILLMIAALAALLISNSPWEKDYFYILDLPGSINLGYGWLSLSKPLLVWVNDLWMAIFFCLVGLEIKREFLEGELSNPLLAKLPLLCALGGMVVPALIYALVNAGSSGLHGWAIPSATDIAFALGILTLLGPRVPASLKIFLAAVAIIDDLGAIVIIALFYTQQLNTAMLLGALVCLALLYALNRARIPYVSLYAVVGAVLWVFVLKSGVHATLAGVATALAIPLTDRNEPSHSPLKWLEHSLYPWVTYLILPVFAFFNAGINLKSVTSETVFSKISLGIILGLVLGKTIGVFGTMWLMVKLGKAQWPTGASVMQCLAVSMLAGIGFTMSLFIGGLAFGPSEEEQINMIKVGVLTGSLVSGLAGTVLFLLSARQPRLRQL